jgi:NhaC family Na+:H+ antiporter
VLESGTTGDPKTREPSLLDAIVTLGSLIVLIAGCLLIFGLDALNGPLQVALLLACMVAVFVGVKNGYRAVDIQLSGERAISSVTSALFILLAVGALIGTWNLSGTIATMVYYGIQVLAPAYFYVAAAVICGVVSLSIGSSWTTSGTIGVGLVGIAGLLGVSPAITAGAVISGAYLGDKLSPLSETTVLSAQLVKVDIYQHIRRQVWTSLPAFGVAAIGFTILGVIAPVNEVELADDAVELASLSQFYNITPLNLLPLVLLVILSIRRVPAAISLMLSAIFAGLLGAVLQPQIYADFVEGAVGPVLGAITATWQAMASGFTIDTGLADIDRLLSRGGMDSMLSTLWLIFGAVTFGTLIDELGLIRRITEPLLRGAKSRGRLFLTVFATAFGLNVIAGDQYIALVLPARIFRMEFAKRGIQPAALSRLIADSGTVTSPLVPWNSCGAFMAAVLGVPTLVYLPYAFFNIASPVLSVLYGVTGFKIEKVPPVDEVTAD